MTVNHYEKIIELLIAEIERKNTDIYLLRLKIEELNKGEENNG